MGLTVARHALRNLGGEVSVVDGVNGGASSILRHPLERHAPLDDAEAEALARDPGIALLSNAENRFSRLG